MKQHILSIEAIEGRRNDLRRRYNQILRAGAKKSFTNNLHALNGIRIFHATHTKVTSGIVREGKIVVDALSRQPHVMNSYKQRTPYRYEKAPQTDILQHRKSWFDDHGNLDTSDNWVTGEGVRAVFPKQVFTSPSQFCVANWASEGITRSCNGWREANTVFTSPFLILVPLSLLIFPMQKGPRQKNKGPKTATTKKPSEKNKKKRKNTSKKKTPKKKKKTPLEDDTVFKDARDRGRPLFSKGDVVNWYNKNGMGRFTIVSHARLHETDAEYMYDLRSKWERYGDGDSIYYNVKQSDIASWN